MIAKLFKNSVQTGLLNFDNWSMPIGKDNPLTHDLPNKAFGLPSFEYGGSVYECDPWDEHGGVSTMRYQLEELINKELETKVKFKFCLASLLIDGDNFINPHHDLTTSDNHIVATVFVGSPRIFIITDVEENTSETFILENGDLFVMNGEAQKKFTHSTPRVKGVGPSVELTFRM